MGNDEVIRPVIPPPEAGGLVRHDRDRAQEPLVGDGEEVLGRGAPTAVGEPWVEVDRIAVGGRCRRRGRNRSPKVRDLPRIGHVEDTDVSVGEPADPKDAAHVLGGCREVEDVVDGLRDAGIRDPDVVHGTDRGRVADLLKCDRVRAVDEGAGGNVEEPVLPLLTGELDRPQGRSVHIHLNNVRDAVREALERHLEPADELGTLVEARKRCADRRRRRRDDPSEEVLLVAVQDPARIEEPVLEFGGE